MENSIPIPWKNETKEVIDLQKFATEMKETLTISDEFTSGQFGLQMIEGVQKVRLVFKESV